VRSCTSLRLARFRGRHACNNLECPHNCMRKMTKSKTDLHKKRGKCCFCASARFVCRLAQSFFFSRQSRQCYCEANELYKFLRKKTKQTLEDKSLEPASLRWICGLHTATSTRNPGPIFAI
jgi:hypothetical protein